MNSAPVNDLKSANTPHDQKPKRVSASRQSHTMICCDKSDVPGKSARQVQPLILAHGILELFTTASLQGHPLLSLNLERITAAHPVPQLLKNGLGICQAANQRAFFHQEHSTYLNAFETESTVISEILADERSRVKDELKAAIVDQTAATESFSATHKTLLSPLIPNNIIQ